MCFAFTHINAKNFPYYNVSEVLINNSYHVTHTYIITLKTSPFLGSTHSCEDLQTCNIVFKPESGIKKVLSASFNGEPISTIICESKNSFQFVIPSDVKEGKSFSIIIHFVPETMNQIKINTITAKNSSGGINYYYNKEYVTQLKSITKSFYPEKAGCNTQKTSRCNFRTIYLKKIISTLFGRSDFSLSLQFVMQKTFLLTEYESGVVFSNFGSFTSSKDRNSSTHYRNSKKIAFTTTLTSEQTKEVEIKDICV